jgi:hypothetical protein
MIPENGDAEANELPIPGTCPTEASDGAQLPGFVPSAD